MRLLALLSFILILNADLMAKDKVQIAPGPGWLFPVKPELTRVPASRTISDGFYYVLIDDESNLLTNTEYTHYIKQIVNETGVQQESEVSVTFSPEYQQLTFHTINIIRDGKIFNQLSAGAIKIVQEENEAKNYEYNGMKRAYVTLKDVRKNDRIEVAYSLVGNNPVFANKYSDNFYFSSETAVVNYYKTIITIPSRRLIVRTFNNAPAPEERQIGDKYIYHWENPIQGSWASTRSAPSWYDPNPMVEVSEFKSWEEVVTWGLTIFNNYQYTLPGELSARIDAWKKKAAGDQDLFANLATHFVQDEVRYLGLEIGANTHRPHAPAEVFNHRFGDCKDKALLLTMILHQAGIPSWVALVNTDIRDKLTGETPGAGVFDHAIVAIGRSVNEFIYIDPTISEQRGELLNRATPAYGYSLILKPGETQLRKVDPPLFYNSDIVEEFDVKSYDTSLLTVTSTYAGGAADKMRSYFAGESMKDIEEGAHDFYAKVYQDILLDGPILSADDSIKDEMLVTEHYKIPMIWHKAEDGDQPRRSMDFFVGMIENYLPDPGSHKTKDGPLALSFPRTINYTAKLSMPEDWGLTLNELHIKNDSYQFDFTPSISGTHILLHYYFKTFKDHIPEAALADYKSDYKAMEDKLSIEFFKEMSSGLSDRVPNRDPQPATSTKPFISPVSSAAVWLTMAFALVAIFAFRFLNAKSVFQQHYNSYHKGYPLTGWVVVLGVSMGLIGLWKLANFVSSGYYNADHWKLLEEKGGASLRYYILVDMSYSLLAMTGIGVLLFWLLKRRDIFPRMFTWYMGLMLSFELLIISFARTLPDATFEPGHFVAQKIEFMLTCIYGAIWIAYLQRSEQVKGTFIHPPY